MGRALLAFDRQSDKLMRLVAQLLDVSRIQTGRLLLERRRVDLVDVAREATSGVRATTPQPIVLVAAAPVWGDVDALRLEQVLVNLLDNAVKYSQDEGPIELSVAQPAPGWATLSVRDWGVGIPVEHRRHVFERFYQAQGSRLAGGMGLGLHISRQIVEVHGGQIRLEAPPDGGTRFVVTLPTGLAGSEGGDHDLRQQVQATLAA